MKEFNLLEGEEIIEEIKPLSALRGYFFVQWLFWLFMALFITVLLPSLIFTVYLGIQFVLIFFVILLITGLGLTWVLSNASYNKFYYWITNKRLILKRGIIGYQIVSIPHERISDIIISRTFFENIFGIASLHIQSLAGQTSFQRSSMLGSEGQLFAIPNPEETQNKILNLVRSKRKEEGLTM